MPKAVAPCSVLTPDVCKRVTQLKKGPAKEVERRRRRGRPPGDAPPIPNAERQRAHRLRLRNAGKQFVHLALPPSVVRQLDLLRAHGASREEVIERLISAESLRKKR
jgi:hypothetical protein